ncbi:hypothetical protein SVIOM342S_01696 [Streptomyces violaceorubidus]
MTATTVTSNRTRAATGGTPALVVVAHGSRDPRALSTVRALLDRVRALRPGLPVHLGHIELNAPLLPDTLAALGDGEAVLVPLLLSRGHHVGRDIPEMAAAAPARTRVAAPLGPHPLLSTPCTTASPRPGGPRTRARNTPSSSPRRAPAPRPPAGTRPARRRPRHPPRRPGCPRVRLGGDPDGPGGRARADRPGPPQSGRRLLLHGPGPASLLSARRRPRGSHRPRWAPTRRWPTCSCAATKRPGRRAALRTAWRWPPPSGAGNRATSHARPVVARLQNPAGTVSRPPTVTPSPYCS